MGYGPGLRLGLSAAPRGVCRAWRLGWRGLGDRRRGRQTAGCAGALATDAVRGGRQAVDAGDVELVGRLVAEEPGRLLDRHPLKVRRPGPGRAGPGRAAEGATATTDVAGAAAGAGEGASFTRASSTVPPLHAPLRAIAAAHAPGAPPPAPRRRITRSTLLAQPRAPPTAGPGGYVPLPAQPLVAASC